VSRSASSASNPARLVELPREFAVLMLRFIARGTQCGVCQSQPAQPALCLLCGRLLCSMARCCASVDGEDEVFRHEAECVRGGRGLGAVLLLRSSVVVLLLGQKRVCLYGSLYLDEHGEEDVNLARGRPLYLSRERFERLDRELALAACLMDTKVLAKTARAAGM
jgi:E3 ubiquitin-protein ligase UBR3